MDSSLHQTWRRNSNSSHNKIFMVIHPSWWQLPKETHHPLYGYGYNPLKPSTSIHNWSRNWIYPKHFPRLWAIDGSSVFSIGIFWRYTTRVLGIRGYNVVPWKPSEKVISWGCWGRTKCCQFVGERAQDLWEGKQLCWSRIRMWDIFQSQRHHLVYRLWTVSHHP